MWSSIKLFQQNVSTGSYIRRDNGYFNTLSLQNATSQNILCSLSMLGSSGFMKIRAISGRHTHTHTHQHTSTYTCTRTQTHTAGGLSSFPAVAMFHVPPLRSPTSETQSALGPLSQQTCGMWRPSSVLSVCVYVCVYAAH